MHNIFIIYFFLEKFYYFSLKIWVWLVLAPSEGKR